MNWPPRLLLYRDHLPWCLDATGARLDEAAFDALDWPRAFAEMAELEAGAVANASENRQVGHYWLRAPERAPTVGLAAAIGDANLAMRELLDKIRSGAVGNDAGEPFTDVVHIGIGGSALGPQMLVGALGTTDGFPVHFLDNADPDGIQATLATLGARLRTAVIVVVSKSGSTPEPGHALNLTRAALASLGVTAAPNLIAVTTPDSPLDRTAAAEGWLARLPLWSWVGGRCSALSAAGLITAELAGVDSTAVLSGARDMDAWTRDTDPWLNPAALFAGVAWIAGHGRGDRGMVVLPYADRLAPLSAFIQALFMESLGKHQDRDGRVVEQGLTVLGHKGSTDQHALVQQIRDGRDDFMALLVQVLDLRGDGTPAALAAGDQLQGFLLGTRRALAERARPALVLTVPSVDAYALGGLVALIERTVGLYASLANLNAYDQPGVEAGKRAADALLDLSSRIRGKLVAAPAHVEALAAACDADPTDVLYLLRRLALTGRLIVDGSPVTGLWRLR